MARALPENRRGDYRPACPSCNQKINVVYAKPKGYGKYESTGECRNCGPVAMPGK